MATDAPPIYGEPLTTAYTVDGTVYYGEPLTAAYTSDGSVYYGDPLTSAYVLGDASGKQRPYVYVEPRGVGGRFS